MGTHKISAESLFSLKEKQNLMQNPSRSGLYYGRLKRRLSKYTRFSFKNRKHFSPQQKSAISRAWNKFGGFVLDEEKGINFTVIKVTRKEKRELKNRYLISNRGLITSSDNGIVSIPSKIKRKKIINILLKKAKSKRVNEDFNSIKIAKEHFKYNALLSDRSIVVTRKKSLLDIYFPLLPGELINELASAIIYLLKPMSIHLAVNRSKGTVAYTPDSWEEYESTLVEFHNKAEDDGYDPFKGVHASWITLTIKKLLQHG